MTHGELVERFEDACAAMAMALTPRPLVAWSPAELQAMWSRSCRQAGADEHVATVLLNRVAWPACFPALTDHAAIIARFSHSV
jgi:hypothetical protein